MALRSHNLAVKQSLENGREAEFSGSDPKFALAMLNELPVPRKSWTYELGFKDESSVRRLQSGERQIDQGLAERIIDIADSYTTLFSRYALSIAIHRLRKKGLLKESLSQ